MGLFDTIRCEYPLPVASHQDLEYQTKSLDSGMERYTITPDGRLIRHSRGGMFARGPCRDIEWPVHGDIEIYTNDAERNWIEYIARFTHGRVEWIRPLEEARRTPGFRRWDDPVTEEIAEFPEPPEEPAEIAPAAEAPVAADPADSGSVLPRPVLPRDGRPLREPRRETQLVTQRVRGASVPVWATVGVNPSGVRRRVAAFRATTRRRPPSRKPDHHHIPEGGGKSTEILGQGPVKVAD